MKPCYWTIVNIVALIFLNTPVSVWNMPFPKNTNSTSINTEERLHAVNVSAIEADKNSRNSQIVKRDIEGVDERDETITSSLEANTTMDATEVDGLVDSVLETEDVIEANKTEGNSTIQSEFTEWNQTVTDDSLQNQTEAVMNDTTLTDQLNMTLSYVETTALSLSSITSGLTTQSAENIVLITEEVEVEEARDPVLVAVSNVLQIDTGNASNVDEIPGLNWSVLLGGNPDPDLLSDIYDAIETGSFTIDLLEDIDEAVDSVVDDAVQWGKISADTRKEVRYLIKYNYLDLCDALMICDTLEAIDLDRLLDKIPDKYFILAVRIFQLVWGMHPTGFLDAQTKELIKQDRCGNEDTELIAKQTGSASSRRKRYVIARGWDKNSVSYATAAYPFQGSMAGQNDAVDLELDKAFAVWNGVSKLEISRSKLLRQADIQVGFYTWSHGDVYEFDGNKGTLAHAFLPDDGNLHFDDDEKYVGAGEEGTSLFQTAVHELGHSLGFHHSEFKDAVMYPFYKPTTGSEVSLFYDDIQGLNLMYGELDGAAKPDWSQEDEAVWTSEEWCKKAEVVDAAFLDPRGSVYLFSSTYVTSVDAAGVRAGFPKKITEEFSEMVDERVSAAFTLPALYKSVPCDTNGNCRARLEQAATFILQGTQYYMYRQGKMESMGFIVDKFQGVPARIDAAYTMKDGNIYFIKSGLVFRLSRTLDEYYTLDDGFPQLLTSFFRRGVGSAPVSAGLFMYSGKKKFYNFYFTDDLYFRYSEFKSDPDFSRRDMFPRLWQKWFCRCGDDIELVKGNNTKGIITTLFEEVIMSDAIMPDFVFDRMSGIIVPNVTAYQFVLPAPVRGRAETISSTRCWLVVTVLIVAVCHSL